jgi:hypothetical protein
MKSLAFFVSPPRLPAKSFPSWPAKRDVGSECTCVISSITRLYFWDMPDSEATPISPPPVLDCARVLHYAVLNAGIEFSGRSLLFVDGKEVGRVPALAICEVTETGGVLLFHCTDDWSVLGCSAHESVSEAKARAERVYKGVSTRWVDGNVSREAAEAYLNDLFENERCSVCGKRADEVDSLVQRGTAWLCNRCSG